MAACRAFCEFGPTADASLHMVVIALTEGTDPLMAARYSGDTPASLTSEASLGATDTMASTAMPWPSLDAKCRAVSPTLFLHPMML